MANRHKKVFFSISIVLTFFLGLELISMSIIGLWPSVIDNRNSAGEWETSMVGGMPFDEELLWKLPETMNNDTREANRILFLGDSSVWGFGVDKEKNLVEKSGNCLQLPTENAGVPGYTSTQMRVRFEQILSKKPPQIVVVAALWSDMMQSRWTDRELYAQFGNRTWADRLDGEIFWNNSALYRLIRSVSLNSRGEKVDNPKVFWNAIQKGDPSVDSPRVPLRDYRYNLKAIHEMADRHKVKTAILLLPTNTTEPQPDMAPSYRLAAKQIAETHDSIIIDMDLAYRNLKPKDLKMRFLDVVHPNEMGHAEIAASLCKSLRP